MKKLLPLIIAFLLLAGCANATTYYVKSGGNDSLDGLSDATAWATIAKVQATITSGDTVYFRSQDTWTSATLPVLRANKAGVTYDGSTYGSGTRAILTTTIETASYAVVFIEENNVTLRGFDINGNAKRVGGIYVGAYGYKDVSNTVIDNCKIHNTTGISGDWNYGILVTGFYGYDVYNTTITNCEVYDVFHEGIAVYATWTTYGDKDDGVLIRNCSIHETGNYGAGAGTGIAINNDAANVTVEYCDLYNNSASGVGIRVSPPNEGAGNILAAPTNFIIRYNLIRNNWVTGISLSNERTMVQTGSVYGNIFYNNGNVETLYKEGSDVNIRTGYFSWRTSKLNFYDNTFYNTAIPVGNNIARASFLVGANGGAVIGNGAEINLKNNIFYMGDYPAIKDWTGMLTHSNNLIYPVSGDSYTAVEAAPVYTAAISPTSVTVTSDATYTYFTKADDATDWSAKFNQWDRIRWTGFDSPYLGDSLLVNIPPTKNQIRVYTRVTPGYYEDTVTGAVNGSPAIPSTKVGIWTYIPGATTYFLRAANSEQDWRTIASVGDTITWSGWSNPVFNSNFTITAVAGNYIVVAAIWNEFPETTTVTAERAIRTRYYQSTIHTWEPTAQNTDPAFESILYTDPLFLHLQNVSPAIDAGTDVGLTRDYDGNAVPQGLAPDIGAFEYIQAPPTCALKSDIPPCDGCVSDIELTAFITRWYMSSTDVTLKELMEAIGYWKRGAVN
jgi:hypothetical protein